MSANAGRAEVHPFDVAVLEKGEWITPDQCERALGMSRQSQVYDLKLLSLAQILERHWMHTRGEQVTICSEKDGLRICTDDKAVEVNRLRRQAGIRAMERAHVRQGGVDMAKLTTSELRELHDREMVVGAAYLLAGKKSVQAALRAHRRSTPGLPTKR